MCRHRGFDIRLHKDLMGGILQSETHIIKLCAKAVNLRSKTMGIITTEDHNQNIEWHCAKGK